MNTQLTNQQIDAGIDEYRERAAKTSYYPEESRRGFDVWLAAVEDRAKRQERRRLLERVAYEMPESHLGIVMTPYREGVIEGVNRALKILEVDDD